MIDETKPERKRVVAWAVVDRDLKSLVRELNYEKAMTKAAMQWHRGGRPELVKLVEHDPSVDAVVRAAVAHEKSMNMRTWNALRLAVKRYERKRKR